MHLLFVSLFNDKNCSTPCKTLLLLQTYMYSCEFSFHFIFEWSLHLYQEWVLFVVRTTISHVFLLLCNQNDCISIIFACCGWCFVVVSRLGRVVPFVGTNQLKCACESRLKNPLYKKASLVKSCCMVNLNAIRINTHTHIQCIGFIWCCDQRKRAFGELDGKAQLFIWYSHMRVLGSLLSRFEATVTRPWKK